MLHNIHIPNIFVFLADRSNITIGREIQWHIGIMKINEKNSQMGNIKSEIKNLL